VSPLERRLAEDRALRDAALGLFKADLALVREDLKVQGIGSRVAARIGDATMDTLDDAIDFAGDNKAKVGLALAAVVLWFARRPIIGAVEELLSDDTEPGEPDSRSDDD
jgi:hypothetical protein